MLDMRKIIITSYQKLVAITWLLVMLSLKIVIIRSINLAGDHDIYIITVAGEIIITDIKPGFTDNTDFP